MALINKFVCKPVCAGNSKVKVGHLDVNEKGENVVVFDDVKDQQAIIDSYADQCKIENIIARYASGDSLALIGKRGEGSYIDEATSEALEREPEANAKILADTYKNLYNNFAGKDNISYSDFIKIIQKGEYQKLDSYIKKEEEKHE